MMEQKDSLVKEIVIQIGSGAAAGFSEICVMHPLDLVKTRLQMQKGTVTNINDPKVYTGIKDCFLKMYKHEGILSYYKGILPPMLMETPKRAVKFFTFEQYKKIYMFGSPTPTPLTFALAGLSCGVTEGFLVNPFEVVKVTMQANKSKVSEVPNTIVVTRNLISTYGYQVFLKGMPATMWRNGLFNMVYFGFYHSAKGYVPIANDPLMEFSQKVLFGFTAGTIASCVNIPFDVIKTRIQMPITDVSTVRYSSTFGGIAMIYKDEGLRALYKGLLPKVLRLGPGGAIMLIVYDYMHDFLKANINL